MSYNNFHDSMQEKFAESTPAAKAKHDEEQKKLATKVKQAKGPS